MTYDCQINPNHILLTTFSDDLTASYDAVAPQAVAPGKDMVLKLTPAPFTVAAGTSGGTVSEISNVVWKVKVPTGSTVVSQTLEGGSGLGAGTPTVTVAGGNIVLTVPGPIAAGSPVTMPTVVVQLTATGAAGSRIEPKVAGTSYGSPGLTFSTKVTGTILGTLNPTLACFPGPAASPALHSTLISTDTLAPKITITSPQEGQQVPQGSQLIAGFTCDDGDGVGVASCVGTKANGAGINTGTLGAKTFTVTATDNEGKVATTTVNYTVVAP